MNLFQDQVNYRRSEVADALNAAWPDELGLRETSVLIQYLKEVLPHDDVVPALTWRLWGAVSAPVRRQGSSRPDLIRSERDRIGRWIATYPPETFSIPGGLDDLWFALDACFDPEDDELEAWCKDVQDDVLEEIMEQHEDRHDPPPEGEPPAVVS
jgi:hypothetical protein